MTRLHRPTVLVALVALLATLLGACGSDDTKGSQDGDTTTPAASALPKAIRDRGVLNVGSDIEYAPIEFFKEGTKEVQGLDYDLGAALAKELGVKVKFINDTDFGNIIPAMNNGRFDIIMSAMTDTKERQQGADFIDYFVAGSSILVKKGNPDKIKSIDDVCGKTVAVQKGTVQDLEILTPHEAKCQTDGKAMTVLRFEKDVDALQQVKNGRAVANFEDFPVAAYNANTSGKGKDFDVVGQQIGSGPYGIAVPKGSPLVALLQKTLKKLIADGTYGHILEKWNLADGALKTAAINGGT